MPLMILATSCLNADKGSDAGPKYYGTFSFVHELNLPGDPEKVYDACTGEVGSWWDHSFSEKPVSIYFDAVPGGLFKETFDSLGNGAVYATVIYADRARLLRFDGPMGLSEHAIHFVHTYTFQPSGTDSTLLRLDVHASGEITDDLPGVVEGGWRHFLFDQLKPYVERGLEF